MTPLGAHRLPVSCGPYPHTCTLHSRVRSTLAQAHAAHVAAHTCGLPIHTSDRCAHTHAHPALTHRLAPGCCCFGASSQSASISFLFPRRAGPCRDTQAAVAVGQSSARAQHMFVYNMSLEGSAECCARPRGREPRLSLHSRWRREGASSATTFKTEKGGSLVCRPIRDGEGREPRLPPHSRWRREEASSAAPFQMDHLALWAPAKQPVHALQSGSCDRGPAGALQRHASGRGSSRSATAAWPPPLSLWRAASPALLPRAQMRRAHVQSTSTQGTRAKPARSARGART